jgi:hypothetical protein
MSAFRRLTFVLSFCCIALLAQRSVDPHSIYHRVVGVLPLAGSGTAADPIRPKYAPPGNPTGAPGTGIIAYAFEFSDDGKYAIAELVAVDRTALPIETVVVATMQGSDLVPGTLAGISPPTIDQPPQPFLGGTLTPPFAPNPTQPTCQAGFYPEPTGGVGNYQCVATGQPPPPSATHNIIYRPLQLHF